MKPERQLRIECGRHHYLGHYADAASIRLTLWCHRCKGHWRFETHAGRLIPVQFVPKAANVGTSDLPEAA